MYISNHPCSVSELLSSFIAADLRNSIEKSHGLNMLPRIVLSVVHSSDSVSSHFPCTDSCKSCICGLARELYVPRTMLILNCTSLVYFQCMWFLLVRRFMIRSIVTASIAPVSKASPGDGINCWRSPQIRRGCRSDIVCRFSSAQRVGTGKSVSVPCNVLTTFWCLACRWPFGCDFLGLTTHAGSRRRLAGELKR
jgi:hypothetical protein